MQFLKDTSPKEKCLHNNAGLSYFSFKPPASAMGMLFSDPLLREVMLFSSPSTSESQKSNSGEMC